MPIQRDCQNLVRGGRRPLWMAWSRGAGEAGGARSGAAATRVAHTRLFDGFTLLIEMLKMLTAALLSRLPLSPHLGAFVPRSPWLGPGLFHPWLLLRRSAAQTTSLGTSFTSGCQSWMGTQRCPRSRRPRRCAGRITGTYT